MADAPKKPSEPAKPKYSTKRWSTHLDEIDSEIARLCLICKVKILAPGVIKRVLDNDATVCEVNNPKVFEKLRSLVIMHYSVRERAVGALGSRETMAIMEELVAHLRERFGDTLG
jgi:hypothetical protein